jgi:hypothetical protein
MENYGEAYKRELERAKLEAKAAKRGLKPTYDVNKTVQRFQCIVEDLQKVNAPISAQQIMQTAPSTYALVMNIGGTDYEVVFFNDTTKVYWRGRDKTPMVYDALSPSRMNALARVIIERAVTSALTENSKPTRAAGPRVVKFPQP